MSAQGFDPSGELSKLAQHYWNAWAELAPKAPGEAPVPGFKQGLEWWSQLAGRGNGELGDVLGRVNAQAGEWFGAMQELVAGFAGKAAAPADIAQAWRERLGGIDANPVADMFRRMGGVDAQAMDAWSVQAAPFIGALRGEADAWLKLPSFGLAREHQVRWQKLAQAQLAAQQNVQQYQGVLAGAARAAFERFERKLGEHSEPGRQLESARALFDLWIDAAEEAWAELALSGEYRRVYADLVNSQMRLRAGLQHEVERVAGMLGLPTRSEVNASHRKLATLEREVRALKAQLAQSTGLVPERGPARAEARNARPASARAMTTKARTTKAATPTTTRPPTKAAAAPRAATRRTVLPQVAAPRAPQRSAPARKTRPANRKAR